MRILLAPLLVCSLIACGGEASSSAADEGGREDDFAASDYGEDSVLPYAGDWLDPPHALAGIGQFDRLRGTVHDDAKCSTMVGISAAIVGGKEKFLTLLGNVERLRAGRAEDLAVTRRVRQAVDSKTLTARHIHELTEVMVRAYDVAQGAYDGQISRMVRASGYTIVKVGSSRPDALVNALEAREVVPLATVAENIPHITLLWKDARGVVRLYDSDDIHGSHVLPRGSAKYNARVNDPQSAWALAEKYR